MDSINCITFIKNMFFFGLWFVFFLSTRTSMNSVPKKELNRNLRNKTLILPRWLTC